MKKISGTIIALATLLLSGSCGKTDNNEDGFRCSLVEQDIPAGDSAVIYLPNAFSPNGDGLNDGLGPMGINIASITFSVYDNKNNLLYTSNELNKYWSAPLPVDMTIYYYTLQAVTTSGHTVSHCGTVYAFSCIPPGISRDELIFGDQYDPNMPQGYHKGTSYEMLPDCF